MCLLDTSILKNKQFTLPAPQSNAQPKRLLSRSFQCAFISDPVLPSFVVSSSKELKSEIKKGKMKRISLLSLTTCPCAFRGCMLKPELKLPLCLRESSLAFVVNIRKPRICSLSWSPQFPAPLPPSNLCHVEYENI